MELKSNINIPLGEQAYIYTENIIFLLYNTASKSKKQNIPTYICQYWILLSVKNKFEAM